MGLIRRAWRGARAEWKLHILSCVSLSVAFMCFTAVLIVVFNLGAVRERWSRVGRASIYLRDGVTAQHVMQLRHALDRTPGITSVRYVTSEQARELLVQATGDALLQGLPQQAFPSSLEVDVAGQLDSAALARITHQLKQIPEVESVETYDRYASKLQGLTWAAVIASIVLAAVVLAAVLSVVGSTVRLSLQRRSVEVDVLRLVGATQRYVSGPFVVEGSMLGAAGAALAVAVLGALFLLAHPYLSGVVVVTLGIQPVFLPWYGVLGAVALGAALGAGASYASLRRMVTI